MILVCPVLPHLLVFKTLESIQLLVFFFFEEGKEGDERERRIIKFLFNFFCLFL
jgi:hypothetical protein